MQPNPWQFDGRTARLDHRGLCATIDLLRPAEGLSNVCFQDSTLQQTRVLRVVFPDCSGDNGTALLDGYARGADLVATYAERAECNVLPQVYWRAIGSQSDTTAAGIELDISVQTPLLNADPRLMVASNLPTVDVRRLVNSRTGQFERVGIPGDTMLRFAPNDGAGLFLFRMPDSRVSFAQMVHPADFAGAELISRSDSAGVAQVAFRLFEEGLEKGIIRRARVRGYLLPSEHDERLAASSYHDLLAAAPSLTT